MCVEKNVTKLGYSLKILICLNKDYRMVARVLGKNLVAFSLLCEHDRRQTPFSETPVALFLLFLPAISEAKA
jgi:hypothetical protein